MSDYMTCVGVAVWLTALFFGGDGPETLDSKWGRGVLTGAGILMVGAAARGLGL